MRLEVKQAPPRPSIPLLLSGALIVWLVVLVGYQLLFSLPILPVIAVSGGVLGGCVLFLLLRARSTAAFLLLFVALGVLVSAVGVFVYTLQSDKALQAGEQTYLFTVIEDKSISSFGESYYATTRLSDGIEVVVRTYFNEVADLALGTRFQAVCELSEVSEDARMFYAQQGTHATASISAYEVVEQPVSFFFGVLDIRRFCLGAMESYTLESDYMLRALLLGDQTLLSDTELYQDVKVCGLAHLIAVSGAHLVVVSGLIASVLRAVRLSFAWRLVIQIAAIWFYLVLVGFPESCLRAACMSCFSIVAALAQRKSSALSALGLVALFFIGSDPASAFSISFALSFLSTLGIILFCPLLLHLAENMPLRLPRWVSEPFAMTLISLLLTFPLTSALFSQFSLISPVANILTTPLITVICALGLVALALIGVPYLGQWLLEIVRLLAQGFDVVAGVLADVPFAAIPLNVNFIIASILVIAICIGLWIAWTKFSFLHLSALCTVVSVVLFFPFVAGHHDDQIIMMDVGQGDAFVIRSNNQTLLVDTGNQTSMLYAALARNGVHNLNAVLITHPDDDHCGSLTDLAGMTHIGEVLVAHGSRVSTEEKAQDLMRDAAAVVGSDKIREVCVDDVLQIGDFKLTIIAPEVIEEAGNADSICFLLEYQSTDTARPFTALFCGDAESEQLEDLIEQNKVTEVTIYKVGHHGSKAAINAEQAKVLSPEISLVSVGENNRYGHPNGEVLGYLEQQGSRIYRSDISGDVTCNFFSDRIQLATMK